MPASAPIRSRSHPALKRARAVRVGKEPGRVLLEGLRLVEDALGCGVTLESVLAEQRVELARELAAHAGLLRTADGLLDGVGELKTGQGILAVAAAPPLRPLSELEVGSATLLAVLAGVADPGNVGALVRAAEAAGASGVAVADCGASPLGGRALRGSMGSAFRLPLFRIGSGAELPALGLRTVAAATRGGADYRDFAWERPLALWIPAETGADGLAPPTDTAAVTIPMAGRVESLNVATAATLLLFEAARANRR